MREGNIVLFTTAANRRVLSSRSSAGLERLSDKQKVGGSTPLGSTKSKETVMKSNAVANKYVYKQWQYAAAKDNNAR